MPIMKLMDIDAYFSGEDVFPDQESFSRYKKAIPQKVPQEVHVNDSTNITKFADGVYLTVKEVAPGLIYSILNMFEKKHLDGTCEELRFLLDVIDDMAGIDGDEMLLRYWLGNGLSLAKIRRSLALVREGVPDDYSAAKYYRLLAFEVELESEAKQDKEQEQTEVCYSNCEEG